MKVLDIYQKDVYAVLELSIEEVKELLSTLEKTRAIHAGNECVSQIMAGLSRLKETVDGS